MEKVLEISWNVMEFGFENCVGTLIWYMYKRSLIFLWLTYFILYQHFYWGV